MKRYPAYKDSGVEWLGEVPEGWESVKIGRHSATGMGQTILKEMVTDEPIPGSLPVFSASESDVEFGYLMNPNVKLNWGDLIIGARGSIGMTRFVSMTSTCTQTTIWLKVDRETFCERFVLWSFTAGREALFPYDKTAIPMLTVEQVRSGRIPLPPLPEQRAIAAFLDRETAKIDGLIEEQRRLIALLAEKRQATISHAVTRGLNPDTRLKPSGIDWLGDVPEGWVVTKLRNITDKIVDGTHFTPTYVAEGVPFLRVTDISKGDPDLAEVVRIPRDEHEILIRRCDPRLGDLLLSKNGSIGIPKSCVMELGF